MKYIFILIITLTYSHLFSQEISSKNLDKIYEKGKLFTSALKKGEIESLKKANPPKDMWLFSKLEVYKQNLGSNEILYGSIILPSVDETSYSYNLFAYDVKKEFYYFVAAVSYELLENDIKFKKAYLFTEKKSLKNWWETMFKFYRSESINNIPKKYLFDVCPPPPFKE